MTNKEYLDTHGKCIHTGTLGYIEAYIRMQCMLKSIEFDDHKIEEWLKNIDLENSVITCAEIIEKTLGPEYVTPWDGKYGFDLAITPFSELD